MRITIEIERRNEWEKLSTLFKAFNISTVNVISANDTDTPIKIRKGDKKTDPKGLFGIWVNNPRSLESIRKNAWQRKPSVE